MPDDHPHTLAFWDAYENGGTKRLGKLTIKAAYEKDKERYGGNGRDETPFEYAVASFAAIVGDKDVRDLKRADVLAWIDAERKAKRPDGKRKVSDSTIGRRKNSLQGMLTRFYRDNEIEKANPFAKHDLDDGNDATKKLPFTSAHLALIDSYVAKGKATADTRKFLRLLKFTAAGPAEIGGLVLGDVFLDADIPFAWVRRNSLRGLKLKKGKEKIRERKIPLIGEALDAARDAVARTKARAKANPHGQLFKAFCPTRGADKISSTLNGAIRRAGVPFSPRLSAYSFRHGMVQAMKAAGVEGDLRRLIAGHHAKDAHDKYGSPSAQLSAMRDALLSAVPHLGVVEESDYTAAELSHD